MSPAPHPQLQTAFVNASLARARLEMFAQQARSQGREGQAQFYDALAASLKVHTRRFLMLMRGKLGDGEANLKETTGEMLPGLLRKYAELVAAADQNGKGVAGTALDQSAQVAQRQGELAQAWGQEDADPYLVCSICGWVATGEAPERCPVCGAVREKFQPVS
jgi:rubrerythrin